MEPNDFLCQLADRATKYAINLDGRLERDPTTGLRRDNALVYRGTLLPDGRAVTIKTVLDGPQADLNVIKQILREAHTWSKLKHPNILGLLGITTNFNLTVSIVTPWMGGASASVYVQNQENDPRPLIKDIARGLRYLHSHPGGPIIHGSLKGENVLISSNGRAVLTDFGLPFLYNSAFSMTTNPLVGGTLRWMAPELVKVMSTDDFHATVEGDIWAFGTTTLELFTRKLPYCNLTKLMAVQSQILKGPPKRPPDEETCSRMTTEWWDLCLRCLRMDPSSRIRTTDVVKETRELPPRNDIVIVVMGPTGSGMSNFINKLAGSEEGPEANKLVLRPHAMRELTLDFAGGQRYVFVDTPGFDCSYQRNQDTLRTLSSWLREKYLRQVKIAGVVYTHRITDSRISDSVRENLGQFGRLCGDKAVQRVRLVTTMWDEVENAGVPNWVSQLQEKSWGPPFTADARHERFSNTRKSALDIVNRLVGKDAHLTEEELVDAEKQLRRINAARAPYSRFHKLLQQKATLRSFAGNAGAQENPVVASGQRGIRGAAGLQEAPKGTGPLKLPLGKRIALFFCKETRPK